MSILKYITEIQNIYKYMDVIDESYFLTEIEKQNITSLKPKNFEADDNGVSHIYSFDIEYTEDGKPQPDITMYVNLIDDCTEKSMYIDFNEKGGDYSSVRRGKTHKEIMNVVKDKMNGVAYCIYYDILHLECELNVIEFSGTEEEKDLNKNINRRNKMYISFAKKYFPDLDIKIKDIDIIGSSVLIHTEPFGKNGNTHTPIDIDVPDMSIFDDMYTVHLNHDDEKVLNTAINSMIRDDDDFYELKQELEDNEDNVSEFIDYYTRHGVSMKKLLHDFGIPITVLLDKMVRNETDID